MARPQSNGNITELLHSTSTQMQNQLNESARTRQRRPESPYKHVDVLLLQWEDDDLKVDSEVTELERVFATKCHFTTHRWSIPSINGEDKLIHRILQFRRDKTEEDLLILYYAGHAGGDAQQCIWAATKRDGSPELNWHNVQYILLGSPADVLIILDCCFASLAARNCGTGANWFLGASAKESVAAGVSRSSFTSALTREIDRYANQYWTNNEIFTVQSIHHGLTLWDRDLAHTPSILRLTDYEVYPTELTPLLYPRERPQMPKTNTEPLEPTTNSSNPPSYIRTYLTTPLNDITNSRLEQASSGTPENRHPLIELTHGESQTLRVTGLPFSTKTADLDDWFENRLARDAVISKVGPMDESPFRRGTKDTIVTFSSVALAMQALTIRDVDFQATAGNHPRSITIDKNFNGLTCVYSSIKSVNKQPSVDIVLVHGAFGHAINSFACHYLGGASDFFWPRDALAGKLEEMGVYPRILTFGWNADAWLNPNKGTPHSCDELITALKTSRPGFQRPLIFIGHGVGGLLVKEAVNETINFGFNFPHFENPIKACFFFAVPNRAEGIDDGFPRMLANMRSALQDGVCPDAALVRALRGRNNAVSSLSKQFEEIRQEHGVKCITFNGNRETSGCMIVPSRQGALDDEADSAYNFDLDYRDIMRLPRTDGHLQKALRPLVGTICGELGVLRSSNGQSSPDAASGSTQPGLGQPSFVSRPPGRQREKEKERVFGRLRSYDTVFLVDDSDSMYGPRWETTKHVLAKIASIAVQHDKDGVDIRFFNEYLADKDRLNLDSAEKVMTLFGAVEPYGLTPTADVLEVELNEYVVEYQKDRHKKGLNLIMLTDGEPDRGQDVEGVIVKYARKLANAEAPPLQVGVQFVQVGGDKKAAEFLKSLDDDLQHKFGLDRDVSTNDGLHVAPLTFVRWLTLCHGSLAMRSGCTRKSFLVGF